MAVILVGGVSGNAEGIEPDVLALTLPTAAPPQDTVPVKAQAVKSSQSFLDSHPQLAAAARGGDP